MFFETGKPQPPVFTFGPISMSSSQIFASMCASFIAIPPVTLVVTIFKKTRTKDQEQLKNEIHKKRHCAKLAGVKIKKVQKPLSMKTANYRWSFLGYIIAVVSMLVSGFFTILYSMQFGRAKAERWFVTAMSSFFQDVIFIQPMKVAGLSMVIALILKKIDNSSVFQVNDDELFKANEISTSQSSRNPSRAASRMSHRSQQLKKSSAPIHQPPSKFEMQHAKKSRSQEKRMNSVLWEMVLYFGYLWMLLTISDSNRKQAEYHWIKHLDNTFSDSFMNLLTVDDFWRWNYKTLIPTLYGESHPSGGSRLPWKDRQYMSDLTSFRVGPARLRQIRKRPSYCWRESSCLHKESVNFEDHSLDRVDKVLNYINHIISTNLNSNKADYLAGQWRDFVNSTTDRYEAFEDGDLWRIAYLYQDAETLRGVPYAGILRNYDGGGYSMELGVNKFTGRELSNRLYQAAWIDDQSYAVFLEFTLYNPSCNLFATVMLVMEFHDGRGAAFETTKLIQAYQLYPENGKSMSMMLFQIAFCIYWVKIFLSYVKTAWFYLKRGGIKYLKQRVRKTTFWEIFDWTKMWVEYMCIVMYSVKQVLTGHSLSLSHSCKYFCFSVSIKIDIKRKFSISKR